MLVAEPGAGKTTRVPLALLDAPWLQGRNIVMLEPRRLAARAAAMRMAATVGEAVGETVGYTVRLDRRVSPRTRIEVVTEGILTRRLQSDPLLEPVGLLIFDEFHERSLDGDLGLALALDVQRGLREDLKVLVMSATLDSGRLSAHLGSAPVVRSAGRIYPVETRHLERATRQTLSDDMARAIVTALHDADGSVLAFLPGEAEIRRTAAALGGKPLPRGAIIAPLYGALSFEAQQDAIAPAPPGQRKIVLASDIAETSLTIEGIGIVIDSGFKRVARFSPATGMTALETIRVPLASADQRRGRAGRLGPGVCYRLWPEAETRALLPFATPEIAEADLAPLALELAAWGVADPTGLPFLDPPPLAAFAQARDLLIRLEALDPAGALTGHGKAMAGLPLHPRLAHMVLRAKSLGAGGLAADLAALLEERDVLGRSAGVDVALRLDALRGGRELAQRGAKERIREVARQIRRTAAIAGAESGAASPGLLLALAFPDRIGQGRGGDGRFRLSGGGGAVLAAHDPLARAHWLAVAETDGGTGDQRIYLAAALSRDELNTHFAGQIVAEDVVAWDSRASAVEARRRLKLGALVLEDKPLTVAGPEAMAMAMLAGVRQLGLSALPWNDGARNLQARVAFLLGLFPEQGWPDLSDTALVQSAETWLLPYLAGMTRRAHLDRLDLHAMLISLIAPPLQRDLDRLAPVRVEIPSGAEVRIDYTAGGDPVLRARLQEMFGLARTPRIADGRAKLRIELLSPAGRPLAVTQSLETFWTNAYPQVRAEMRGRYPKHAWPEDPVNTAALKPRQLR